MMIVTFVNSCRAAVILCQKDNLLYEKKDKFIYSNQWIPLSEKCTVQEKLRLSSILDTKCSGGAIAHINLEHNFPNTDMAWDMLNKIAESGVIYFAFNTRIFFITFPRTRWKTYKHRRFLVVYKIFI